MKKTEKAAVVILSFVISSVLAAFIFAKLNIYPGGRFTILTYDLAEQYMPLIASLRYLGQKDCTVSFSMFGGLGVSYLSNIAYYMADPLAWMTVLVPLQNLPDAIYFITLIKFGLSGASFCLFVFYGLKGTEHKYAALVFSVSYALMSYNIFFSMSLMWLNGVILLPIILIGIEGIIRGKRGFLFVASLTASLYSCYYLTYMTGIFTFLYILYRLAVLRSDKKGIVTVMVKYVCSAVVSLGLSMPIIYPSIKYTALGKMAETADHGGNIIRVTPLRILRNLLPDGEYFMQNEGAPQLYCGIFALMLIFFFFLSKDISLREKLITAGFFGIFFLSFMLVPLDRIWHGFRDPVCFPARYAYTCTCFMLIVAFNALKTSEFARITSRFSCRLGIIMIAFGTILLAELYFNGTTVLMYLNNNSHYQPRADYVSRITKTKELLSSIDDTDLYRVINKTPNTHDDGFLFGFNDIAYFSSSYNYGVHSFLGKMGYGFRKQVLHDIGSTPVMESLLSVKYYIGNPSDYCGAETVIDNGIYSLCSNPYALPIGFLTNIDDGAEIDFSDDPFNNHNRLVEKMIGEQIKLYDENPYTIEDYIDDKYARSSKIQVQIKKDGPVWVYFPLGSEDEREKYDIDTTLRVENWLSGAQAEYIFEIMGKDEYRFMTDDNPYCVYIGEYKAGDQLNISSRSTVYYHDPFIVTADMATYREVMKELSKGKIEILEHGNGTITGIIEGKKDKQLVLSLPYLKGYNIRLDGITTNYRNYNNAFVCIAVPEGKHTISLEYKDPDIKLAIILAAITLLTYFAVNSNILQKDK